MDVTDVIDRVQAAAGDPEKLALATLDLVLAVHGPDLRTVVEAAAIPHWFTAPVLARLLSLSQSAAEDYVQRLSKLPMVEAFAAHSGWNVHEATRRVLRRDLARHQPQRFLTLSQIASQCFPGEGAHEKVETLFHRLIASPAAGAVELRYLHDTWLNSGKLESIQSLEHALAELVKHEALTGSAGARCHTYLASLAEGYLTVAEVEELARDALKLLETEADDLAEMDARDILGDALKEQNRYPEALDEFRRCSEIASRLVQENPEEPKWQRELSVSHNKVGSIYQAQGLLDEALVEYQAYKDILEKLTKQTPEDQVWQRELAVAYGYVGDLYMSQDKLVEALKEHESYNAHMRQLALSDPDNSRWQNDLAASCRSVGSVKRRLGRHTEALSDFEEYRNIIQSLTEQDPENVRVQADLAYAYWWVADAHDALGKRPEALAEARHATEILQRVSKADPGNQPWQKSLKDVLAFVATLAENGAADGAKTVN